MMDFLLRAELELLEENTPALPWLVRRIGWPIAWALALALDAVLIWRFWSSHTRIADVGYGHGRVASDLEKMAALRGLYGERMVEHARV